MEQKKVDIKTIQKQYGKIFLPKNEKAIFNKLKKYEDVDFDDFLTMLSDYYLWKYSGRVNRNSWLVFGWLKYLTRNDGFVCISYNQIISLFCNDNNKVISKPTFFKCVDELVLIGLIYRIPTFRVYDDRVSNDSNVYCIVDKSDIIYSVCDIIHNTGYSQLSVFHTIENSNTIVNQPDLVGKRKKQEPSIRFKLLKVKFRSMIDDLEEFFVFLGSFNSSGDIALSRKVAIMEGLLEYVDPNSGCTKEHIQKSIMITMKNTAKSSNAKKERYMFSILKSMCEKDDTPSNNKVAEELSKKAETILAKNNPKKNYKPSVNKTDISKYAELLKSVEGFYKTIISKIPNPSSDEEIKLVKESKIIESKFLAYKNNQSNRTNRMKLLEKHNIFECITYNDSWSRLISWIDSGDKNIHKSIVDKILGVDNLKKSLSKFDIV